MSVISIRLPSNLLHDLESNAHILHVPRAEYIRRAIVHLNEEVSLNQRTQQLKQASLRVRKESMKVNAEFSQIEHDPDA